MTIDQEACLQAIKESIKDNFNYMELRGLPDKNGKLVPFPIEDPEHLDERRQQMRLIPFSDHKEIMEKIY